MEVPTLVLVYFEKEISLLNELCGNEYYLDAADTCPAKDLIIFGESAAVHFLKFEWNIRG